MVPPLPSPMLGIHLIRSHCDSILFSYQTDYTSKLNWIMQWRKLFLTELIVYADVNIITNVPLQGMFGSFLEDSKEHSLVFIEARHFLWSLNFKYVIWFLLSINELLVQMVVITW